MQDRFAIGPVTIVQLVGLNTKPRIASPQVDAAVRAADLLPPTMSAAAGFGSNLEPKIGEVATLQFDIKSPPMLALTAPDMRPAISFEGAVDRPVSNEGNVDTPFNRPDELPSNIDIAGLIATLRNGAAAPPPEPPAPVVPTAPIAEELPSPAAGSPDSPTGAAAIAELAEPSAIFDGVTDFGDDMILDFEAYYTDTGIAASGSTEFAAPPFDAGSSPVTPDVFASDLDGLFAIDAAGLVVPDPHHPAGVHDGIVAI